MFSTMKITKNFVSHATVLFAFLFFNLTAQAAFYIEPHVGLLMGGSSDGKIKVGAGEADFKGDASGTLLGARVGMEVMGTLALGLAYETGTVTIDFDAAGEKDSDADTTSMGVFAAFEFPILLRVYGSYMLSSKAKSKSEGVTTELEGNGTRIGVGFTGLPFVSINLEMFNTKFDEATMTGFNVTSTDVEVKGFLLGVSLPLSL